MTHRTESAESEKQAQQTTIFMSPALKTLSNEPLTPPYCIDIFTFRKKEHKTTEISG